MNSNKENKNNCKAFFLGFPISGQNMSVSLPVTPIPTTQRVHHQEVARSTANYPPNIWGDRFLTYAPDDTVSVFEFLDKILFLKAMNNYF